jgi:CRP/FNR family transcriptional regulator
MPARRATAEVLRRVPYFASLPAIELRRLAERCTTRTLGTGEALFEEGKPCRGLLIVADGLVEIRQISLRGREQVFHTEGPSATLGEAPLFDGGGYIASAVALAPTRVLFLARPDVLALCHRRPAVALAMRRTMARRVRHFASIVSDLAFHPVTERGAHYLDTAVGGPVKPGARVDIPLTHARAPSRTWRATGSSRVTDPTSSSVIRLAWSPSPGAMRTQNAAATCDLSHRFGPRRSPYWVFDRRESCGEQLWPSCSASP